MLDYFGEFLMTLSKISLQDMCQFMRSLEMPPTVDIQTSTLNPLAEEFIPSSIPVHHT